MRNYVIINGVNSLTIPGLAIKDLPPISKPLMRNQKETVDGRNGDLVTKLGYSAYDKTMTIGLYGNYDINQIIAFFNQEGTIVFSDEDDKYYNFKILEQIDFAKLVKFRAADVRIHCQPFKYPIVEEPIVIELEAVEEEGTSATLNNTAEAPLKIDLEGNTYQETTLGTNYFNANAISSSYMAVAEEGKTITINAVTSGNGGRDTGKKLSQLCPNLQVDDVVYLYFTRSLGTTYNNFIYLVGASVQWTNGTSKTITQAMLDSNVYLYANRFQDGETGNCILTDFRIVENTTDAWEKFTNNQPSPNPQYPQEVQVVTGDNTIVVSNKNLYGGFTYSRTTNNVSFTHNLDGSISISISGSASGNAYSMTGSSGGGDNTKTLQAGTYALSGGITNCKLQIIEYPSGNLIAQTDSSTTFTTTEDKTYYIRVEVASGTTGTYIIKQMLEKGSTATQYVAHQGQEYEINLGKNLLNKDDANCLMNAFISSSANNIQTNNSTRIAFIKCKPNTTYTVSKVASQRFIVGYTYDTPANLVSCYGIIQDLTATKITITTDSNAKYLVVFYYHSSYDTLTPTEILNSIQIEKGNQATTYSPYFTPIELCKIGTYKDYLYKSGDKWYKHTEIGKVVLDGTENWSLFFNTNGVFVNTSLINAISDNASINCISDNFTGQTRSNIRYNLDTTDGEVSTSGTELVLSNKSISTTTDFQTWLSTHNTSVYYILATATEEEITNSDLINQLDSLLGATSYLDQTNVNQENNNLAFNMKVSALKKGSNEAVINNTGNIYAKPILELEGSGISGIYIGNTQLLSIDMISDITIDTELMEAYDPDTLQLRNRQITGSYENIKLEPGNTTMKVSGGITKVTIKNWKRWL